MSHGENLTFRRATTEDGEILGQLYAQLNDAYDIDYQPVSAETIRHCTEDYPHYRIWLVGGAGTVLGSYSIIIIANPGHAGAPIAVLENVVVDKHARGKGIGSLMTAHAYTEARKHGAYKIALSTNQSREDAHRFYTNLGYEMHGISQRFP